MFIANLKIFQLYHGGLLKWWRKPDKITILCQELDFKCHMSFFVCLFVLFFSLDKGRGGVLLLKERADCLVQLILKELLTITVLKLF
jgi:hypothetical protein